MSGIAGVIRFDGAPVLPGVVEKMTAAMAYRGPDGIRHHHRGNVALGHCMLHTTAESLAEAQPLANEDESLVLVMDGRVDNWEEMRRDLLAQGARLRDRSDAELVLRAFETWNRDCLQRIEGDFAFVIWDARRREAFCARDPMGNKQLHYHWTGTALLFATELHALLEVPGVPQVPNEGMLAEFLAGEWYARNETLWDGILRLEAAHCMAVGSAGPRPDRYWEPDLDSPLPYRKDEEFFEHYRELLADSVRRNSRSHRTVAVEVSGGLDSSAVFCIAEDLRRSQRLPAPAVEGYTMTFAGNPACDEVAYVRALAAFLGVPVHEIPGSVMPLEWYAGQTRRYRDFPGFPNGSMCMELRRRSSAAGSRVTLTGEGGDALLQGSRAYYAEELAALRWSSLRDCFRADARAAGAPQAMRWFARHGAFPLLPAAVQAGLRRMLGRPMEKRGNPHWLSGSMQAKLAARRPPVPGIDEGRVRRAGQLELLEHLQDAFTAQVVERMERDAARFGLEMRHPFRDARLVQFALSCPARLRMRGDTRKYLHVRALAGLVPDAILQRTDKADFSSVIGMQLAPLEDRWSALPRERPDWLAGEGTRRLLLAYNAGEAAWPMWVLWGIHGCDQVFQRAAAPRRDKAVANS